MRITGPPSRVLAAPLPFRSGASQVPTPRSLSLSLSALLVAGAAAATMAMTPASPDATVAPQDATPVQDTAAVPVVAAPAPAAAPVAAPRSPSGWPVDPVTGQTLVNGKPVRGRVFVMHKVDVDQPYDIATRMNVEPLAPEAAIVGAPSPVKSPTAVRRHRGAMVQATLWLIDDKPGAVKNRRYYPVTTGAALGGR